MSLQHRFVDIVGENAVSTLQDTIAVLATVTAISHCERRLSSKVCTHIRTDMHAPEIACMDCYTHSCDVTSPLAKGSTSHMPTCNKPAIHAYPIYTQSHGPRVQHPHIFQQGQRWVPNPSQSLQEASSGSCSEGSCAAAAGSQAVRQLQVHML